MNIWKIGGARAYFVVYIVAFSFHIVLFSESVFWCCKKITVTCPNSSFVELVEEENQGELDVKLLTRRWWWL